MSQDVNARLEQLRSHAEDVCEQLRREAEKLKLSDAIDPDINRAKFSLGRDPANGGETLVGVWRDDYGFKQGEILFHADGSFFAEYDIVQDHPTDKRWFVEASTAWGRNDSIKSELRLIPVPQAC